MWKGREKTDIEMGKKERKECMLRNGGLLLQKRISYFNGKYSNPMRSFSAKELQKATDNYNHGNLIFTCLSRFKWYKGCLEGRVVFVKKYFDHSIATHSRGFLADPEMVTNEMSVAAQVSGHKNSLKLLGCCLETQIPTLVFEFPMNGNLGDQLRSNPTCLSWKSRLKIANEIASVLTYLHTAFPRPIIHRDIYPGNFYLDQDLCAKLSDFTLCMALPEGKTQVQSLRISGTVGYLAPEVLRLCVYSEKSDVFGFGLLLFDLLTGKDYRELVVSKGSMDDLKEDYLMDCIQSYIRNHGINGIVDPTILAEGGGVPHHHQFQAVFRLILKCRRMNADERPIMLDVAKQLRRIQRHVSSLPSSSYYYYYFLK
ncbi:hypothetical protein PVL29_025005 [Vitis rotundifolia]|uniref:Protein kinase domain-containing protein n=1 Tax=Vitis rotundifolia TaxID=103349 RepID=A0AA38YTI7_VITRO|nr:hypothetical protein PVL29_025005 [Vitis rotundifolia]